jgi:predicted metal-binding membrane protein
MNAFIDAYSGIKLNTAPCGMPGALPPCGHDLLSIRIPGCVAPASRKRSSIVNRPVVFPLGVALASVQMQHPALTRAVPIAVGVVILMAGSFQLTEWKERQLACCREAPGRGRMLRADAVTAWRHGLRLGLHCANCSVGLMAILLVIGVMNLRAMAVVAAAITVERLAPTGEHVARATGIVVLGEGLFLIARAARLG